MTTAHPGRPSVEHQMPTLGSQEPPKKPDDLTGKYAHALWDMAVETLAHVLRPTDTVILRMAADVYELYMTTDDDKIKLSASRLFINLSGKIGLDPSSRRIVRPAAPGTEQAGLDELDNRPTFDQWMKAGALNSDLPLWRD